MIIECSFIPENYKQLNIIRPCFVHNILMLVQAITFPEFLKAQIAAIRQSIDVLLYMLL